MSDGTKNTMPNFMADEEKVPAADAAKDDPTKVEKPVDDKGSSEELELDAEIEKESKRGKPDPVIARDAFKQRKSRKQEEDVETGDEPDDAPLTRADLAKATSEAEERAYRRLQQEQAVVIAKSLATSEKEAQLILLKWQNRTWPQGMSLSEQIEESYVLTHGKKLIGERNEALRVVRNGPNAANVAAETHRDAPSAGEPKISDAEKASLKASGFMWDDTRQMYTKSLGRRGLLCRDPKTGKTFTVAS
jgi:hypothetical protein